MRCWICGDVADSREHLTKKSDLKSVYGTPSQVDPLYFSNDQRRNVRIGSLDAKLLKSPAKICIACNTSRAQPHDRAWEQFSPAIRSILSQRRCPRSVRANAIFPYDTHRMMLNVHLYFVKLFGCHIVEQGIPIDLTEFSFALQKGKAVQNVYMHLYKIAPSVGTSDIHTLFNESSECVFATWFYEIDNLAVNVMYAKPNQKRDGLVNAWHPRLGTNKLQVSDFC
jgi:hypothetical protein